jgi:hypothetical protein
VRLTDMHRIGPYITLLVVALIGVGLLVGDALGDPARRIAGTATASAPTSGAAAATSGPGAAATTAPAAATAAPPAVAQAAYAGRSSGNEVTVAIAVKDGRAVAYICDGKAIEAWLEGTVTGSDVTLRSKDGSATISGTVDPAKSLGTVAAGGKQWPYAAKAVSTPNGLYRGRADVKGVAVRIGWIVLPDGTQTGLGRRGQETIVPPPLDPGQLGGVTVDGTPVTVATIAGDSDVTS